MTDGVVRGQNALTTVLLVDPLALPLTKRLAKTELSPNVVTGLSALTTLLTAILFAHGSRETLMLGGLTFYVSFLLDCTDGKLARLTGSTSEFGEKFDLYLDSLRKPVIFPGLLFGHFYQPFGYRGLVAGIILIFVHYAGHIFYNRLVTRNASVEKREHLPAGGYEARELSRLNRLLKSHNMYCTPYTKPDEQFLLFIVAPLIGAPVYGFIVAVLLFFLIPISAEVKSLVVGGPTW